MLLGFKTQLKLNNKQKTVLARHAGVARHAFNWGLALTKQILDHNQAFCDEKIKFPSAIDLHKWLVALVKSENSWYYESSKCAPQYAIAHLRDAWTRCFNKQAKPPKFKKKGRNDSFTLDGTIKVVDHLYGSELVIVDRWFPSSKLCSNCGWRHPGLKLSDRIFCCGECNLSIDRDWNASLNLSRWSHHQTIYACGQAVADNLG